MNDEPDAVDALIPKQLQPLVFRFFVVFSRFECALKRVGLVTKKVEADWDKFAKTHRKKFAPNKTLPLKAACDYVEANPPRKQTYVHGTLSWSPPTKRTNEPQLDWLLCMVRRVRNNLFHGGKYPFARSPDPVRDPMLLAHALTILNACLELDAAVSRHFHNPLQ